MNFVWLNERLVRAEDAHIPPEDRSFRLGDGLFETIACFDGTLFNWKLHLSRLQLGAGAIALSMPEVDLKAACEAVIRENGLRNGIVRLAVSRGSGSRGYLPVAAIPQVIITAEHRTEWMLPEAVLMLSRYRKIPPECLPVQFKMASAMNSTLARLEACDAGCDEAIQLTVDGMVAEASSANLVWYHNEALYTPALKLGVLDGTTRRLLINLAPYKIVEGSFRMEDMLTAEAIMLTGVGCGVRGVASIKGTQWRPSNLAVIAELQFLYQQEIERQCG